MVSHTHSDKIDFVCFKPFFKFEVKRPDTLRRFFDFRIEICNQVFIRFLLFGYGIDFGFQWYDVVKAVGIIKKENQHSNVKESKNNIELRPNLLIEKKIKDSHTSTASTSKLQKLLVQKQKLLSTKESSLKDLLN